MKLSKKSEVREVLEDLSQQGIRYCILRNYENFDREGDVDILVDSSDLTEFRKILDEHGYIRKDGSILSVSVEKFHVQVQACSTSRFEKHDVLDYRRKEDGFYILGKEDELRHLIVQGVATKGYYKEKYQNRILELKTECDLKKVEEDFESLFGETGIEVFNLACEGSFDEVLNFQEEMREIVYSPLNKIRCLFYTIRYQIL